LTGLIAVPSMQALNLTWNRWLPGIGEYPDVPLSLQPDSFEAPCFGLTVIVAASLTVPIMVALRLGLPPKPQAEPAIAGAPCEITRAGPAGVGAGTPMRVKADVRWVGAVGYEPWFWGVVGAFAVGVASLGAVEAATAGALAGARAVAALL
jgi:hypothetical protein